MGKKKPPLALELKRLLLMTGVCIILAMLLFSFSKEIMEIYLEFMTWILGGGIKS